MRIGIHTFHENFNPGCFLQAYATMKTLAKMGHEAIIINYTSPAHRFHPWRDLLSHPGIIRHWREWLNSFGRNSVFSRCQTYLNKTQRFNVPEELSSLQFDAIVVGSDIVWDYQTKRLGQDPSYFGKHLNTKRLIAFAPSCGNVDLRQPVPQFVRDGLFRFCAIAVRDNNTAALVERVTRHRPSLIADPTFTLDLSTLPETYTYDDKYILIYALPCMVNVDTQHVIKAFARQKNLRIIAVSYRQDWVDENYPYVNPFEWIARFRCAQYVYTGLYHGTIFALRLGKAFVAQYNPQTESKIRPLLERLGLQQRVCDRPEGLPCIFEAPWAVRKTLRQIADEGAAAKRYLSDALAGVDITTAPDASLHI